MSVIEQHIADISTAKDLKNVLLLSRPYDGVIG